MTLDEYQQQAGKYQLEFTPTSERVYGLMEECGEVAGVFKRLERGDYNKDRNGFHNALKKELGDVLWYISRLSSDYLLDLSDVAHANLLKLETRKSNNTIHGTGDAR